MYRLVLCSFALLSLTACALGVMQREALTPAPPTATATLTPMPTDVTQPTPTTQPTPITPSEPTPAVTPEQIRFSPGATSATVEGSLVTCDDSDIYRLTAMEGQTMQVTVTSPEDDVIVTVTRQLPDGTWEPMVRSHFLETSVAVFLPATGDYEIGVMRKSAVAGDCESAEPATVSYTLVIEIPPLPSPGGAGSLTLEILKNAEYQIPGEGPFQLEDGIHYLPPLPPDEPPENWTITLVEPVAFGDVNGDGIEDGVVILNAHYGGSGIFKYLAVVVNRDGQPHNVASTFLGDRTVINAIDILPSGEIHVDAIVHAPEDPLCCPSLARILRFQLVGEELIQLTDG
jgi:hypothetical protein